MGFWVLRVEVFVGGRGFWGLGFWFLRVFEGF